MHRGRNLSLLCERRECGVQPEHRHDQLQLTLLFEPGTCLYSWLDADGAPHEQAITGPQFLWLAPQVAHGSRWDKAADRVVLYVARRLQEEILPGVIAPFVTSDMVPGATRDLVVWQLAATLRQIHLERNYVDAKLMLEVAGSVARRAMKVLGGVMALGLPGQAKLSSERLRLVEEFIQAQLRYEIHVEDLARKVGLSLAHFTTVFTATTGLAPYKYITRCRMLRAREMLHTGEFRIGEVATAVGIPDLGYFSFRFKQYFSYSPRSVLLQGRLEPAKSPS